MKREKPVATIMQLKWRHDITWDECVGETLEDLKFTEGMEIRCSHLELSLKKKKEKRSIWGNQFVD